MMTDDKKSEYSTSVFLGKLLQSPDLESFMATYPEGVELPPFHEFLSELCNSTGKVPEQVIKQAGIERTYGPPAFQRPAQAIPR